MMFSKNSLPNWVGPSRYHFLLEFYNMESNGKVAMNPCVFTRIKGIIDFGIVVQRIVIGPFALSGSWEL